MVTCKAGYDDVAVCYDVDSSGAVPQDEVTDRIRLSKRITSTMTFKRKPQNPL